MITSVMMRSKGVWRSRVRRSASSPPLPAVTVYPSVSSRRVMIRSCDSSSSTTRIDSPLPRCRSSAAGASMLREIGKYMMKAVPLPTWLSKSMYPL